MEAAVCGMKSIALSYAFFDRNHDAGIIAEASELSTKLIQHLYDNWSPETHLYSVNVPLVEGVMGKKILWTHMLQNTWKSGSCFQVVDADPEEDATPSENEAQIRQQEEQQGKVELKTSNDGAAENDSAGKGQNHMRYTHKHFKWAPLFKDVYDSVTQSKEGNDGWAVAQGYTSVTPLRANFMHVGGFEGEIKL
jgi:tubulin--tyrosine ligase